MPSDVPNDYPAKIRRLRAETGLTQNALAKLVGVSFASINRWENGQARPNRIAWRQIERLAAVGVEQFRQHENELHVRLGEPADGQPEHVPIDFTGNAVAVAVVAEAHRLGFGHLFNPVFATETSRIDPLPHQRIAVYRHMLSQPRLRFLLADDAGAGKTIMAGLYIREMLARRLVRRILVVPPAGLVGNWRREMIGLFGLPFVIRDGSDAKDGNPFLEPDSDRLIVSVDTLAGDRMFRCLQDPSVTPYDLVVFDEAHKLAASQDSDGQIRKTERYKLAEALAGLPVAERWSLRWSARHLLLLTATPHMGRDFPYFCLWRLLDPIGFSTFEAFSGIPVDARRRWFIRRTKEEMVRFDGTPIYPRRISDTHSYDLSQGEVSEQALYDETTTYLRTWYNRARILNRSAARLAMSVFQRRLASSTWALLRSFERRLEKLDSLIDDLRSGRISEAELEERQRQLRLVHDVFDDKTADEEAPGAGGEENQAGEDDALSGFAAASLGELQAERGEVERLLALARRVYDLGEESKFEKLREVLRDPRYRHEKVLIFTEHRDTLEFLVRKLEQLGDAGQIAAIHGGLPWEDREEQVEFFRRPVDEDGALYLVATDAAGEGINLQFCWLMVNYDVPWNPARLEQRMGRIHRYGQKKDQVVILNLVAGKTREGRVLQVLLEKLERIRNELGTDKVFDVVGRIFEGRSLKDYMTRLLEGEDEDTVAAEVDAAVTEGRVGEESRRENAIYGSSESLKAETARLRPDLEREAFQRLLPGYVRRFLEQAAPLCDIGLDGDPAGVFALRPLRPGATDVLWPVMEAYPAEARDRITVNRPAPGDSAIYFHPGEPLFDGFTRLVTSRYGADAMRGAVFVDSASKEPYVFHILRVDVVRAADPALPGLAQEERVTARLVGILEDSDGRLKECPVETLQLLRPAVGLPASARRLAVAVSDNLERVRDHAREFIAGAEADRRSVELRASLPERRSFLERGFAMEETDLADRRADLAKRARNGDPAAGIELDRIKAAQRSLDRRREVALGELEREPALIEPGDIRFLVHAVVAPSEDQADREQYDAKVEQRAMDVARAFEEAAGATVTDVHTPELAIAAGLTSWPGFDLLAVYPNGERRGIEVKGRARSGSVELKANEWSSACNLRGGYWLHVVYDCVTAAPRLLRVQDPFGKLIAKARTLLVDEQQVLEVAQR